MHPSRNLDVRFGTCALTKTCLRAEGVDRRGKRRGCWLEARGRALLLGEKLVDVRMRGTRWSENEEGGEVKNGCKEVVARQDLVGCSFNHSSSPKVTSSGLNKQKLHRHTFIYLTRDVVRWMRDDVNKGESTITSYTRSRVTDSNPLSG